MTSSPVEATPSQAMTSEPRCLEPFSNSASTLPMVPVSPLSRWPYRTSSSTSPQSSSHARRAFRLARTMFCFFPGSGATSKLPVLFSRSAWSIQPVPPTCRSGATPLQSPLRGNSPSAERIAVKPHSRRLIEKPWLRSWPEASKTMFGIPWLVSIRAVASPERPAPITRMGFV